MILCSNLEISIFIKDKNILKDGNLTIHLLKKGDFSKWHNFCMFNRVIFLKSENVLFHLGNVNYLVLLIIVVNDQFDRVAVIYPFDIF